MIVSQRASGSLFGAALGDAMGAPTEFLQVDDILRRFPPDGPQEPLGNPARVTDDTQMMLAVGEALRTVATKGKFDPPALETALRQTLVDWLNSPDNDRAPGVTCLRACRNLAQGRSWRDATVASSKGCGANMRVAPVGLLQGISEEQRSAIAQFQAAFTHGHPTALAASDLTAATIAYLCRGNEAKRLMAYLFDYAHSQQTLYHSHWLGSLWRHPGVIDAADFISRGWDECFVALHHLQSAIKKADKQIDPCSLTGAGWVAEEAFATGLLCFLLFLDDPLAALQRAAVTAGDSDSIACLTGAFIGAYYGIEVWPKGWIERIEYGARLAELGDYLDTTQHTHAVR